MSDLSAKVCIVTPEFPPVTWGGLARSAERVARHLIKSGLDVQIAQFVIENRQDILLDENRMTEQYGDLTVHRLHIGRESMSEVNREIWDCPHTQTLRMAYQSLELLHLDEGYDILQSFFLYPVGYLTGLLANRYGIRHVAALVGNDIKKYVFSPEKAALCRSGLENADRIVCLSRELLELANALTPIKSKAQIIYNSVELPDTKWQPNIAGDGPLKIGAAGIFKYAKGLPYLFKALADVSARTPVILELRGMVRSSEIESYHFWIEKTGIKDLVKLEPPIRHEKIWEWLGSLDLFVLPSVSEGCPNILMEAMSAGLPCVAANVGAVEDLIADGSNGLLVPWGNAKALAAAIENILKHSDRGASLGRLARERMKDFSSQSEWAAWDAVYRGLARV